mgnify:CR=1 FL=1
MLIRAEVFLVRKINEPVTKNRPEDFTKEATSWLENRNSQIGEKFSKEQKLIYEIVLESPIENKE